MLSRSLMTLGRRAAVARRAYSSDMFCMQCAQTDSGVGCKTVGVCGKDAQTAGIQDLVVDHAKRLAFVATRQELPEDVQTEVSDRISEALFSTMTNVNFSPERMREYVIGLDRLAKSLGSGASAKLPHKEEGVTMGLDDPARETVDSMQGLGLRVGVEARRQQTGNEDVTSGREIVMYGLKGMSAYLRHARELGANDAEVNRMLPRLLDNISPFGGNQRDLGSLLGTALEVGRVNFRVMEMLDHAHTSTYGHPEPTKVTRNARPGKCVLISGHDIKDTFDLLKEAQKHNVDVYTHGELLPAHSYPALKKFPNFAGHYGGPWQLQKAEFPFFPGPIVLTSNCLMEPRKSYRDRVYTKHVVGFPGVKHLGHGRGFGEVVKHAQSLPGFSEKECSQQAPREFLTGFGHNAILGVADKVVAAIQSGALKHIFLIGGCDGQSEGRSYFHDLAVAAPKDTAILTLACGKYRFNDQWEAMGDIGGIPRLLDMGQCNDAFGAVKVATALASVLNTDVNSLPISYAISWYEQKAVAVLLTLLHLGIQDIHLGPNLPAFVSPNVLQALVDGFQIKPTNVGDYKADMKYFLANH